MLNYSLGVATNDPINSVFTAANIPLSTHSGRRHRQRGSYATLTSHVWGSRAGKRRQKTRQYAKFAPLVYRKTTAPGASFPGLLPPAASYITLRLRNEVGDHRRDDQHEQEHVHVSGPLMTCWRRRTPTSNPGFLRRSKIQVIGQRSVTYAPDRVNPAPNLGIAWSPSAEKGPLGRILGNNKTVIRCQLRHQLLR